jgi:acyl-CoA reductase-like NAD-dependent aldehyde dehydrogenase
VLLLQVMTVIPFDSDAEAVAIANDCPFGLGSSVFSGSMRRARAIAAQLEAGRSSSSDCAAVLGGGVRG